VTVRPSPIEAARERHRLADVARRTAIFLPTTAGTVTVRCPIPAHGHPDRTPSMRLYLDDDRYYCFGCGAKGDVIQWVRDTEGLGVTEAVSHLDSQQPLRNAWAGIIPAGWLARRAGSGPTDGPDPARTPRRMVLATLEAAWVRYSTGEGHQAGTAYLAGREIDIAVLERVTGRAEVGYTSPGSHGLVDVLRADGFTDDQLVDAGLARRVAGGEHTIDAYRQRALVPVRTEDGDVCGLVGRSVARSDAPKYLNPPRTAVYDKSINLYCPLPRRLIGVGLPSSWRAPSMRWQWPLPPCGPAWPAASGLSHSQDASCRVARSSKFSLPPTARRSWRSTPIVRAAKPPHV
jgi:DNA primase